MFIAPINSVELNFACLNLGKLRRNGVTVTLHWDKRANETMHALNVIVIQICTLYHLSMKVRGHQSVVCK